MFSRTKVAALAAEFLGTGILTYAVLAAVTRQSIPAAFAVGLTLAVIVFFFAKTSGAHFNPAITLGFWTAGKIKTLQAVAFIAVQVAAAFAALRLFEYVTAQPLSVPDGTFSGRGLTAEILGTFVLAFGVAAATFRKYTNSQAAGIVGTSIAIAVLLASTASIAFINPALAIAILGTDSWVWGIYVVGPIIGAIAAINMYVLLFDDERKSLHLAVQAVTTEVAETVATDAAGDKKAVKTVKTTTVKTAKKTTKKATPKKK